MNFPPQQVLHYTTPSPIRESIGHENSKSPSGRDPSSADTKFGFRKVTCRQSLRPLMIMGELILLMSSFGRNHALPGGTRSLTRVID